MATIDKIPIKQNPELFDKVIADIQKGLVDNLGWLDYAFGKVERLVKQIGGKRYYTPNVYAPSLGKGNDYYPIAPDTKIGNFSYVVVDDPQNVNWIPNQRGEITAPFSIVFWFDIRKVGTMGDNRNLEAIKAEILKVLNGGLWLRNGNIRINRIYERAENIFAGFTLDEIDNQFLMHPFGGLRFEGVMTINESC